MFCAAEVPAKRKARINPSAMEAIEEDRSTCLNGFQSRTGYYLFRNKARRQSQTSFRAARDHLLNNTPIEPHSPSAAHTRIAPFQV
jgi:hypothetical protein